MKIKDAVTEKGLDGGKQIRGSLHGRQCESSVGVRELAYQLRAFAALADSRYSSQCPRDGS